MKEYPKAAKLFVEWFRNNLELCDYDQKLFHSDLERLKWNIVFSGDFFKSYIFFNRGSLFEFFDGQELLIDTVALVDHKYFCTIYYKKIHYTAEYSTRFESLNEAFQIAFKLLELKCKN